MLTCESVQLLAGVNTVPVVLAYNYLQALPVLMLIFPQLLHCPNLSV